MKLSQNLNKYQLFSFLGLFLIGLDFWAVALALVNFFYWPLLVTYLLLGGLFLFFLFFRNAKALRSINLLFITILALAFVLLLTFSFVPTVFSGRDQGSFSEAAVRLAQNHQLSFSSTAEQAFFQIYGPGPALNFPGFSYTPEGNLVTHFSLGYIAWLATFYSLFGLAGFAIANGLAFLLFLLAFSFLVELHTSNKTAIMAILMLISSFVFAWLFKFTLSENLALAFIWFGLLELSLFFKFKKDYYFLLALGAFFVLAFTRIEAWAFLLMLALLLVVARKKMMFPWEKALLRKTLWLSGGFFFIYLINVFVNNQFYLASLRGILRSFFSSQNGFVFFSSSTYLLKVFSLYNILPFLLMGAIGLSYFLLKQKYQLLLVAFIISPTFLYLIHPGISRDHPWMLRRFAFTIIPGAFFYALLVIDRLFVKKLYFFSLLFILIGTNLLVSWPYFTFKENADLLAKTKTLSENFSATDLVLVDRLASGDAWSMLSAPMSFLYGKQAVYFFNPQDLAKINLSKFSHVYLIAPDTNLAFYQKEHFLDRFSAQKSYTIERTFLSTFNPKETPNSPFGLPQKREELVQGKIYLLNK